MKVTAAKGKIYKKLESPYIPTSTTSWLDDYMIGWQRDYAYLQLLKQGRSLLELVTLLGSFLASSCKERDAAERKFLVDYAQLLLEIILYVAIKQNPISL